MGLDEMQTYETYETYEIIIIAVLGLVIYSIGIYMLTILCSNRNKFPFTIISPLWVITFIISKTILITDIVNFKNNSDS